MSNQADTQDILSEFLPEQTPVETPVQETVTEQPKSEEQPVESNSPETKADVSTEPVKPAEKTPEQLREDKAYWQTRAQEALKELEKAKVRPVEEPPAPAPVQQPQPIITQQTPQLTEDEIDEMLRDKPALALQVLAAHNKQQLETMLNDREKAKEVAQSFQREKEVAATVLDRYINENKISEDEVKEAVGHMAQMGIKASPAGANDYIIKHIEFQRLLQTAARSVEQVKAEAAQAVKVQALTQQPGGGQQPAPAQPKSTTDLIKEKFSRTRGQKVLDELFK